MGSKYILTSSVDTLEEKDRRAAEGHVIRPANSLFELKEVVLKGGKMVIIGLAEDQFDAECIKQLKRCGFAGINNEPFDLDGLAIFRISAVK